MARLTRLLALLSLLPAAAGLHGCSQAREQARAGHTGGTVAFDNSPSAPAAAGAAPGMPPAEAPAPAGSEAMTAVRPAVLQDPNMWVSSNYLGGTGARDRLEKLVSEGVLIDGKRVRLEAFSHNYAQAFPIPTKTALGLTADMERSRIIQQGDRTYLQVGLQAAKGEAARRPPLNVALVIDHSGSMQEERKMEFARQAALRLVDGLADRDVVSLVAFDDSAQVLIPARAGGKQDVRNALTALQPGGGTNIHDGLRLGYEQARKYASDERVSLVILLSDGQVTAGVSDPEAFRRLAVEGAEGDIQLTTVGMGVQFSEDLMLSLAEQGQGNYHFIRDGRDAEKVFVKELDELTQVVARAVRLRIRLAEGVGLVRVLGSRELDAAETRQVRAQEKQIDRKVYEELGITQDRKRDDERGIKMLIPNFHRGDSHVVMLEIEVPEGRGVRKVADVFLKYKDLAGKTNRETKVAPQVEYTPDRGAVVASVNRSVKKNLLGFQTGEALMEASALIGQGRAAQAVKRLDERMVVLGVAAKQWGDRDLDRDGQLLDRYKTVVAQLHREPHLAGGDLGDYLQKSLTYAGYQMTR